MRTITHFIRIVVMSLILTLFVSISVIAATPSKVINLRATSSKSTVKLTWSKSSDAYKYTVYQVNSSGNVLKKVTTTKNTSVTIKKLKEGSTYNYRVRAYNKSGVGGDPSDMASVTINVAKPSAPKNFRITTLGNKSINFRWTKISGVTGYVLYQYDDTVKAYKQLKVISPKVGKTYTLNGLTVNQNYKFILKAYKKVNGNVIYSDASDEVTATIVSMTGDVAAVRAPYYTVKTKIALTVKTNKGNSVVLKKDTSLRTASKAGTKVNVILSDGSRATVTRSSLKYTGLDCNSSNDYSTSTKEAFVNLKGLKSKSNYLIWISEYKLKINIFKGSKGHWTLVKSYPCVIGKWNTRTVSGIHYILKKTPNGQYGGPVLHFSRGDGTSAEPAGCAFHHYVDGTRNKAASHGCVRTEKAALYFMYNNCRVGTTVYIH